MTNILIIGCGYVGQALAKDYVKKGASVWALQRHPVLLEGVNNIIADAMTIEELPRVDLIFYLVAPDEHNESSYENAYVRGLKNILRLLPPKAQTKFIFVSSTAVYGQQQGEWVDEASRTSPNDFAGNILLEGESLVRAQALHYAIVRFGGIYGPNRERLITLVREGKAKSLPKPVYTNRIHLDDCVGILQFVGFLEKSDIYLGVDSEPASYNEILFWLGQILQKPIAEGNDIPARLQLSQKRCSNAKLKQLGYQFVHADYRSGFSAILNFKKTN